MENIQAVQRDEIRERLRSIFKSNGKITERDLLRLSALTGVNYSTIVEIQNETRF